MPIEDLLVKVNPMFYGEGMPSYPGLVLARHVAMKGAQVGGVGGLLAGVAQTMRGQSFRTIPKYCAVGTFFVGAPLGLAAVVAKAYTTNEEGIIDRGRRVRFSLISIIFCSRSGGIKARISPTRSPWAAPWAQPARPSRHAASSGPSP